MTQSYRNVYGADTETDHNGEEAWIAQWALSDGKKEDHGTDLRSFVTEMEGLCAKHHHSYVYFHNLNYDWEFIKYAIWKFCAEQGYILDLNRKQGSVITATVKLPDDGARKAREKKGLFTGKIQFRDSMKKRPGSLASLAKSIGMQKLDGVSDDFHAGWSLETDFSDPANWEYVHMDARIVAVAMRRAHKNGFTASTASGDSWKHAKQFIAQGRNYKRNLRWESFFPSLPIQLDRDLRVAYFGGINISEHNGLNIAGDVGISHDDVCSMYPTVMSYDPLPVGEPIRMEVPPQNDSSLWVCACRIKLNVKPGKLAWFTFKNAVDARMENCACGEPVRSCYEWHEMVLTNVDLMNLSRFYDIEFDPDYPNLYWYFKSETGIFKPYIEELIKRKDECKRNGDIDGKNQAKILMNSLYGRFCLNPEGESTEMYYSEDTGDLEYATTITESEEMDAYLPFGLFVTAWARMRLLDHCEAVGDDNVIHCDTDSVIHFGGKVDGEEYDEGLGTWEVESQPLQIYEGGFKRYIEVFAPEVRSLKDISVTCAGVPQRTKDFIKTDGSVGQVPVGMWVELLDHPETITERTLLGHQHYSIDSLWLRELYALAHLDPDDVNTMKLIPRRVLGGVILEERQHQLSDNMFMRLCR